jgi:hypothetical protein
MSTLKISIGLGADSDDGVADGILHVTEISVGEGCDQLRNKTGFKTGSGRMLVRLFPLTLNPEVIIVFGDLT